MWWTKDGLNEICNEVKSSLLKNFNRREDRLIIHKLSTIDLVDDLENKGQQAKLILFFDLRKEKSYCGELIYDILSDNTRSNIKQRIESEVVNIIVR